LIQSAGAAWQQARPVRGMRVGLLLLIVILFQRCFHALSAENSGDLPLLSANFTAVMHNSGIASQTTQNIAEIRSKNPT
jgi:hypothetical protein